MNDDKEFYESLNPKLSAFYSSSFDNCDADHLYPIQQELKSLDVRFLDLKWLAEGAMKDIFEAKELASQRKIAIAKLKDDSNQKNIEIFFREARLTASLQHPNIIRIYDIGYDSTPWFSMELIEGMSLAEKINTIKSSKIDWPLFERLAIFNKVCDAVAYAHSKQILHLDIKPENIRLGQYGEVILCDWGLGHIMFSNDDEIYSDDELSLQNEKTQHGYIRGTPGYMAPERLNNEKTTQADIFSLGALLFSLLNYNTTLYVAGIRQYTFFA